MNAKACDLFDLYSETEKEREALWRVYWDNKISFQDLLLRLKNLAVYRQIRETEIER